MVVCFCCRETGVVGGSTWRPETEEMSCRRPAAPRMTFAPWRTVLDRVAVLLATRPSTEPWWSRLQ